MMFCKQGGVSYCCMSLLGGLHVLLICRPQSVYALLSVLYAVVTSQEREKYWQFLSLYYVTEEADDTDNPNGIVEHHLPWRSKSASQLI